MDQQVMICYGTIERVKAEIEAAKLDNDIRKMQGQTTFNYPPEWFWERGQEIQDAVNSMFR